MNKDTYSILFEDGTTRGYGSYEEIKLIDGNFVSIKNLINRRGSYVQIEEPIEAKEEILSIRPIVLGIYLSLGKIMSFTVVSIYSTNLKLRDILDEHIAKSDKISKVKKKSNSMIISSKIKRNKCKLALNLLDFGEVKRIPQEYLCGSIKQRTDLLEGLMYGSMCFENIDLCSDIENLARGLGVFTTVERKRDVKIYKGKKYRGEISYKINLNFDKKTNKIIKITKILNGENNE